MNVVPRKSPPGCSTRAIALRNAKVAIVVVALAMLGAAFELLPYGLLFIGIRALIERTTSIDCCLWSLAGWMAIALAGKYIFYTAAYGLTHVAAYDLILEVRRELVRKLARAPLRVLRALSSGDLKQRALQDVERIEQAIAHHTVELCAACTSPVIVAVTLFWLDWRLALASLLPLPLAGLVSLALMRRMNQSFESFARAAAQLNGVLIEYVRNMPVMRVFCRDTSSFRRIHDTFAEYDGLVESITHRTVPGWTFMHTLLTANAFVVLAAGVTLERRGALGLSELALVLMLTTGMLKPLLRITRFASETSEIAASVQRIDEILAWDEAPQASETRVVRPPCDVVFDAIGFSYGSQAVLKSVDVRLRPGRLTVLLGPSGSGKSTLAALLAGIYAPDVGEVRINDVPLATLTDEQQSALVSIVSQHVVLFSGTLRENLALARADVTSEALAKAVNVAQAESWIQSLPEGLDTHVGELGTTVSGGERQRIAVARALIARTPILILDEATAFADNVTQKLFYEGLRASYPEKTILIVAHRPFAFDAEDDVMVLSDGALRVHGTHTDLLATSEEYRRLWERHALVQNWSIKHAERGELNS